jgi:hypothetical protein
VAMGHAHQDLIPPRATVLPSNALRCGCRTGIRLLVPVIPLMSALGLTKAPIGHAAGTRSRANIMILAAMMSVAALTWGWRGRWGSNPHDQLGRATTAVHRTSANAGQDLVVGTRATVVTRLCPLHRSRTGTGSTLASHGFRSAVG